MAENYDDFEPIVIDSRLSVDMPATPCDHLCCREPLDPSHQHLFGPELCPLCQTLQLTQEGRSPWKQ